MRREWKLIRKPAALIALVFTVLLLAAACGDGEKPTDPFIGTWEAVDIIDGSNETLSIASGGDGTYDITLVDDRATLACPTTEGSASIIATGTLSSPTILHYVGLVECPSEGTSFPLMGHDFVYDSATDTLTDDFGATFNRAGP